ncbi:efflux RND transporter periplasmic adaptor subunit [Acetonema longum]|uniref:RND family efflux transporter MFP subunit n=1 Tax=Acetonema longum DSM 6540 TaxID=1009370 RepID=F7NMA2_9FIRM|nr:efflux RND transporter periplasmic adaptor subunit [Acetonema longum]EGO62840.1 RND family efflux transporter MFP subunit [Acetonema longum DSM 6540]
MKKLLLSLSIIGIVTLTVWVLLHNKAEVEKQAKVVHNATVPVVITAVQSQTMQENLTKVGLIVANNEVQLVSEASGKIIAVHAGVGSYLQAGAPVVRLDDELASANFLSARTNYDKARKDWERAQELYKQGAISRSEQESARNNFLAAEAAQVSAKRQYENATITTPIAGIVTARPANLGAMVSPGTMVATIIDISNFKIVVNVGAREVFRLKVGDPVSVAADVYPGIEFAGRIESISDRSDEARTFPVEVVIANQPEHPLKSGIYGKVSFQLSTERPVLAIPREAVIGSVKNPQVYVVEDNVANLRDIVIGSEIDTKVEVIRGLKDQERVVLSGQDNLQDHAAVEIMQAK